MLRRSLLLIAFLLSVAARAQDVSTPTPLEQRLVNYYQAFLSLNKQKVFLHYHRLGGTATAVTVTGAKVTQWKGGVDTEQPADIVQFTVDFTILWSSILHPHGTGHTVARNTYQVSNGQLQIVGRQIISTNGKLGNIDNSGQSSLYLFGTIGSGTGL